MWRGSNRFLQGIHDTANNIHIKLNVRRASQKVSIAMKSIKHLAAVSRCLFQRPGTHSVQWCGVFCLAGSTLVSSSFFRPGVVSRASTV